MSANYFGARWLHTDRQTDNGTLPSPRNPSSPYRECWKHSVTMFQSIPSIKTTLWLWKSLPLLMIIILFASTGSKSLPTTPTNHRNFIRKERYDPSSDVLQLSYESLCSDTSGGVVFTYESGVIMDGAGAQLQRLLTVFALSHTLGVGYLHSPLVRIGYQGLAAQEINRSDDSIVQRWNDLFALPSRKTLNCTVFDGDGCIHSFNERPTMSYLREFVEQRCLIPGRHVLHIWGSYNVLDSSFDLLNSPADAVRHPSAFFGIHFPWLRKRELRHTLRVALHIRRGDLFADESSRMLPNSYYIDLCHVLKRVIRKLSVPYVFEIYTELTITGKQAPIVLKGISYHPRTFIDEFDVVEPKELHINEDAVMTMKSLATSDILVLSRSSFSYVAGLLHDPGTGLVIAFPFWHRAPSDWLLMQENETSALVDEQELLYRIAEVIGTKEIATS